MRLSGEYLGRSGAVVIDRDGNPHFLTKPRLHVYDFRGPWNSRRLRFGLSVSLGRPGDFGMAGFMGVTVLFKTLLHVEVWTPSGKISALFSRCFAIERKAL